MPIKPDNRARYPKDWKAISQAAKERASWMCQHPGCTTRQYAYGRWLKDQTGRLYWNWWGTKPTYSEARQMAAECYFAAGEEGPKPIVIVLTVAHLNHQPEDCRPENLAALCQRHHLALDADHHKTNAYRTRKDKAQTIEMF